MRIHQRLRTIVPILLAVIALSSATHLSRAEAQDDETVAGPLISQPGPTFTLTDPQLSKHWTMIAYGDMRFTDHADERICNPQARRALVAQVAAEHPDMLTLSGDVPYSGDVESDYDVFRRETASWRAAHLHVYPAIGNHELRDNVKLGLTNWWHAFPELKNRRWYSVEFANAYLITLDSDLPLTENSHQQNWLIDQLAHLPKQTRFVFFSMHHPPVADSILNDSSHDVRPNELALANLLDKAAAHTHAKFVVIAGHIHNYQRFSKNGVVYLVSGGGGAHPYAVARTAADLYQDPSFPNFHYVKFVYDGKRLNATMLRLKDPAASTPAYEVKDTFTITP